MYYLEELERALALHNEAERLRRDCIEVETLRREHLWAEAEIAKVDEAVRQIESLREMLPTQKLMSPELLLSRRREATQVQVEFVVRLKQGDKERRPNE